MNTRMVLALHYQSVLAAIRQHLEYCEKYQSPEDALWRDKVMFEDMYRTAMANLTDEQRDMVEGRIVVE